MPDLSSRRRLLVLAICCLSLLLVGMDVTIVNVALPSIRQDLGVSLSGLQWVIDAYTRWHAVNDETSTRLQLAQIETDYAVKTKYEASHWDKL